ncbi:MAG: hypothetical protein JRG95_15445, partial [Deltaproteobacteria bacterium]|nr:hypothetical protein [Deltaproteobacteria bacterium]
YVKTNQPARYPDNDWDDQIDVSVGGHNYSPLTSNNSYIDSGNKCQRSLDGQLHEGKIIHDDATSKRVWIDGIVNDWRDAQRVIGR